MFKIVVSSSLAVIALCAAYTSYVVCQPADQGELICIAAENIHGTLRTDQHVATVKRGDGNYMTVVCGFQK